MNFRDERRSVLKKKAIFRLTIFLVSFISPFLISAYIYDSIRQNILLGVACSLLAWSVVEIWDLSVNVYAKYIEERHKFLTDIIEILNNIVLEIKLIDEEEDNKTGFINFDEILSGNNINHLYSVARMWRKTDCLFNKLNKHISIAPLEEEVYCCSSEYETIYNYYFRCFCIFQGCMSDEISVAQLYKKFIHKSITTNKPPLDKIINDLNLRTNGIYAAAKEMSTVSLSSEPYEPSPILISKFDYGVIKKYNITNVPKQKEESYRLEFIPYEKLKEVLESRESRIPFIKNLFFLSLICPRLFSWLKLHW